jgi:hypothetical protein
VAHAPRRQIRVMSDEGKRRGRLGVPLLSTLIRLATAAAAYAVVRVLMAAVR